MTKTTKTPATKTAPAVPPEGATFTLPNDKTYRVGTWSRGEVVNSETGNISAVQLRNGKPYGPARSMKAPSAWDAPGEYDRLQATRLEEATKPAPVHAYGAGSTSRTLCGLEALGRPIDDVSPTCPACKREREDLRRKMAPKAPAVSKAKEAAKAKAKTSAVESRYHSPLPMCEECGEPFDMADGCGCDGAAEMKAKDSKAPAPVVEAAPEAPAGYPLPNEAADIAFRLLKGSGKSLLVALLVSASTLARRIDIDAPEADIEKAVEGLLSTVTAAVNAGRK